MRFTDCLVGAALVAVAQGAACPAVRPVTITTWVTADEPATSTPSASSTETSAAASETTVASSSNVSSEVLASSTGAPSTVSSPTTSGDISSSSSSSSTTAEISSSFTTIVTSSSAVETSSAEPSSTLTTSSSSSSSSTTAAASATATSFNRAYPADVVDKLRDSSFSKLQSYTEANPASSGCTLENAVVRREWSDASVPEREEYIAAVQCLMTLPSKIGSTYAPGAKTRYDDFVAVHIKQTPTVHNTANFLGWHRYYTWAFEQALRNECGYSGYQLYWNWDRYAADPVNSPLFNGNASSISGNSPTSGACVNTGPFANMTVNLGPGSSLKYNPRCLKRDISKSQAQLTTADKVYTLLTGQSTVLGFQNTLQNFPGVHTGGHFTVGGDPGGDIYASPGDPYFFLHHAMIDRIWWIWQMQDLSTRQSTVAGNVGSFGSGSAGSLNDDIDLNINGASVKLGSVLTTIGGKGGDFCYIYY